jgi:hypothetical protein
MGAGLLAIKSGFILFATKIYQFLKTLKKERERTHWVIGPPFVDRKSLATMSNEGGLVGDNRGRLSSKPCLPSLGDNVVAFVFKTLSQSSRL